MSGFLHLLQESTFLWHSLLSLLLLIPLCFYMKRLFLFTTTKKNNQPPSLPKLPIVGNFHQLGLLPHRSLQSLAQTYGPLMLLRLGRVPTVVVSSAEAAQEIMKTHDLIFSNRPKSRHAERLLYNAKDVSLAPYGEYWRQLKSIFVLQLLSNKRVQSFRAVREEEMALLVKRIKEASCRSLTVNLSEMFVLVTNDVVCRAAFGRKYSEGESGMKFRELLKEHLKLLGAFCVRDFIPLLAWVDRISGLDAKIDRVAKQLDEFLEVVIEERKNCQADVSQQAVEDDGREDFLDILLKIHKDGSIDRETTKALLLDIFSAGTDTTSAVLVWAMTELLRHPMVMKKLKDEVRSILNGKQSITEDDLEKMHYLKAVIKETLRLHPPVPLLVPREAGQDTQVMGYDIAAGTMVIANAWAIGRDPKWWDAPEEFRPERFLNSAVDYKGHDFQLIPFGAGRRGCPGIAFAMATNEIVLANLIHKFDWKFPSGTTRENLDMTEAPGVTIYRRLPLLAVATPCS